MSLGGPVRLLALLLAAPSAMAAAQAPGQATAQASLEEIIVTARRRDENLQRTPVSVVALTEAELEARSLANLRSLQYFVPNLTLAPSQNVGEAAGNAFIRGIGQEDFIAGSEAGVGVYVDGIYLATTRGTLLNLSDVERVEVLRGPQGTLFGRNTVGGAINIVTVQPRPAREARASLILGNLDRLELRGVANAPVAGNLFLRLSTALVSRDGYLRRLTPPVPLGPLFPVDSRPEGSDRTHSARLQLRWLATETLTVGLSVDGTRRRNTQSALRVEEIDPASGIFPVLNQLIRTGRLPGPELTADLVPDDFYASFAGGRNFADLDNWGVAANLVEELGPDSVRLILAWRNLQTRIGTDNDGVWFNIGGSEFRDDQRQVSAELQFAGARGPFDYTTGLFAFRERARSFPSRSILGNEVLYACGCFFTPDNRPPSFVGRRRLRTASSAIYAQGSYAFAPRWSATLGARYSYEDKSIGAESLFFDLDRLEPSDIVANRGANRGAWSALTWRVGLDYQAARDLMLYASAARGYKAGGFNVRPTPTLPNLGLASFAPETALTYELGLRSEWFDRRLRLNLTVFHTDYRDIQLRQQTFVDGLFVTLIENAARARIRGAEVELMARPFERLTLSAAYGHLDPKYLDVGRVPGITLDSEFQRTPRHSFALAADYWLPFAGGRLELHGDYGFRSREQFQLVPSPYDQAGYGLLGGRLTLRGLDDRWSAALFGTNLTGERYRNAGRGAFSSIGLPRQYGIQLSARF